MTQNPWNDVWVDWSVLRKAADAFFEKRHPHISGVRKQQEFLAQECAAGARSVQQLFSPTEASRKRFRRAQVMQVCAMLGLRLDEVTRLEPLPAPGRPRWVREASTEPARVDNGAEAHWITVDGSRSIHDIFFDESDKNEPIRVAPAEAISFQEATGRWTVDGRDALRMTLVRTPFLYPFDIGESTCLLDEQAIDRACRDLDNYLRYAIVDVVTSYGLPALQAAAVSLDSEDLLGRARATLKQLDPPLELPSYLARFEPYVRKTQQWLRDKKRPKRIVISAADKDEPQRHLEAAFWCRARDCASGGNLATDDLSSGPHCTVEGFPDRKNTSPSRPAPDHPVGTCVALCEYLGKTERRAQRMQPFYRRGHGVVNRRPDGPDLLVFLRKNDVRPADDGPGSIRVCYTRHRIAKGKLEEC